MKYSETIKTGIEATGRMWGRDEWFTLWLCGREVGSIVGYSRAVSQLKGIARTAGIDIAAARIAYLRAVQAEAAQVPAPVKQSQPRKAQAPRCPFYGSIRQCFGFARGAGLDTKNDQAMREAFARFLGRDIASRDELRGFDWSICADGIRRGVLVW